MACWLTYDALCCVCLYCAVYVWCVLCVCCGVWAEYVWCVLCVCGVWAVYVCAVCGFWLGKKFHDFVQKSPFESTFKSFRSQEGMITIHQQNITRKANFCLVLDTIKMKHPIQSFVQVFCTFLRRGEVHHQIIVTVHDCTFFLCAGGGFCDLFISCSLCCFVRFVAMQGRR
jgi:hypothetical protein